MAKILHGSSDTVVPKEQAELIVKKVREGGGDIEYHLYEGEGHGWRMQQNIVDALERELAFYSKAFQFGSPTALD